MAPPSTAHTSPQVSSVSGAETEIAALVGTFVSLPLALWASYAYSFLGLATALEPLLRKGFDLFTAPSHDPAQAAALIADLHEGWRLLIPGYLRILVKALVAVCIFNSCFSLLRTVVGAAAKCRHSSDARVRAVEKVTTVADSE